jgi:hypothetical protein
MKKPVVNEPTGLQTIETSEVLVYGVGDRICAVLNRRLGIASCLLGVAL